MYILEIYWVPLDVHWIFILVIFNYEKKLWLIYKKFCLKKEILQGKNHFELRSGKAHKQKVDDDILSILLHDIYFLSFPEFRAIWVQVDSFNHLAFIWTQCRRLAKLSYNLVQSLWNTCPKSLQIKTGQGISCSNFYDRGLYPIAPPPPSDTAVLKKSRKLLAVTVN
jgi:hypothetical protein